MTDKLQIVLIFGTFSLVTKAHLAMGLKAKEEYPNAAICYVPAPMSYIKGWNKDIIAIDDNKRVELLKQAVTPFDFHVSTIEIDGEVSGYTYDTVEYFKKKKHFDEVIVTIGMDNVEKIIDWEKGLELAQENTFLIFTRGMKFNVNALKLLKEAKVIDFNEYSTFSSSVAKICYFNKDYFSLMEIVTPEVYMYLMEEYNDKSRKTN